MSTVADQGANVTMYQNAISNIFAEDASSPNYLSILLGREGDPGGIPEGTFTISELIPGLENITDTPRSYLQGHRVDSGAWAIQLDGLIVNGNHIALNSSVPNTPSGSSLAAIDTGTTYPVLPQYMVDAIYSNIPGSSLDLSQDPPLWNVPCDGHADVRFVFKYASFSLSYTAFNVC